jgi:predicted esterase
MGSFSLCPFVLKYFVRQPNISKFIVKMKLYDLLRYLIFAFICTCLSACAVSEKTIQQTKVNCTEGLFVAPECMSYTKYEGFKDSAVIVMLHGTVSKGSTPSLQWDNFVEKMAEETGYTTYLIDRPGYGSFSTSNQFSWSRVNSGNAAYIDHQVSILHKIQQLEKGKKIYAFGHSSGAIILSTIAGKSPNLISKLLLYGGYYNLDKWGDNGSSSQPVYFTSNIPKDMEIIVAVGEKDVKHLSHAKMYSQALLDNGVQHVDLKILSSEGHSTSKSVKEKIINISYKLFNDFYFANE